MRLGGDRVIKIDIRIIASSNKDIKSLIIKGNFRKDLFYRLNVLPLEIMPLRERRGDIMELTERIKKSLNVDFVLTKDAMLEFENYGWEGNVRELRNCIEYLAHLDQKVIDNQDIPFSKQEMRKVLETHVEEEAAVNILINNVNYNKEKFVFIMECLKDSRSNRTRIGRRRIAELAEEKDIFLSENEIRGILNVLREQGLVSLSNGRGGTQISSLGVKVLEKVK
jgi:transcriptional regulator with GAF, ATPase, and Fis domain